MKKLSVLLLGMTLLSGIAFAENVSEADAKWLNVVEKMVNDGKKEVSTASDARVTLVKNWAVKKGYAAEVTKTEQGYKVAFSKGIAKN